MKSWDGLEDAAAPAQPPRAQVRWRAWSATFVTLVVLAGLDAVFPDLKNALRYPGSGYAATPFEWSEVRAYCHIE